MQVEKHYVGRLQGFRFFPDTQAEGIHGKATRNAAAHVLAKELAMRVRRVVVGQERCLQAHAAAARSCGATRRSRGWRRARIRSSRMVVVLADEHLTGPDKEKVQERLDAWIAELIGERLKPLVEIAAAPGHRRPGARHRLPAQENFGVLRRESVAEEIRSLDQPARAQLRKYGVRFGAFNIYFPAMLKPASAELALMLWVLKHGAAHGLDIAAMPEPPRAGLTSRRRRPRRCRRPSIGWPAFTSAARARCASTCWSGWPT